MLYLKENPTLIDIQEYVRNLEIERGFSSQDVLQKCLLLGEEVGELFKAIRKQQQMSIDLNSKTSSVADELADLIIMLSAIANRLDVNLEKALRDKEEINKQRTWTKGI
ncbi:MAG: MazG nucleotide pyrophosphohydrolase domain-containing protein [Pseudobdellovibrionaceae bacterium]